MKFGNRATCPQCNQKVSSSANFCEKCGFVLSGGAVRCGACDTENRGDASFCKECGQDLSATAAPRMQNNRWSRHDQDFAVRITADDLHGLLKRGLIIDPGTNALLVDKGVVVGTVPPGEYTIDSLGGRIKNWFSGKIPESITALLVEITQTEFEFNLGGIFTSDPLRIGASIRLQVQVEQPGKFLINMLKGRERIAKEDLRKYLYPEVVQAAERWIRQHSMQDLADDFKLKDKFGLLLDETLKNTFGQLGLAFLNIRVLDLNFEHIDHIKGIRSKYALQVTEAEAEAAGQKTFTDAKHELDLIKLAEETQEIELDERRVELHQRIRMAVMSDRMSEVSSTAEFDEFMHDMDYDKLLREKERAELLQIWKEESEDHQRGQEFLIAKLDIERQFELDTIRLKQRTDLSEADLQAELRLERLRAGKQFEIKSTRLDYEHKQRRAQLEFETDMANSRRHQDELEHNVGLAARSDDHVQEMQEMNDELEMGLKSLRGMKQVRADAEKTQWVLEREKLEFEWQKEEQRLEMELQRERIQMDHELNRLDKLGELGAEALIAASGSEQGRILADLKKTEALQGMSEDQILALAAKDSPEVARALQEKFRAIAEGQASQESAELYERLLAERDASLQRTQDDADKRVKDVSEAWDTSSGRAQKTAERALDRVAETAQAFARNPSDSKVIITGTGTGESHVISSDGDAVRSQGSTVRKSCPTCGKFVDDDSRHCEHCGHKFEGM
jgi:hypothetical protein